MDEPRDGLALLLLTSLCIEEPVSEVESGGVQRGITPSDGGLGASPSYEHILFSLGKGQRNGAGSPSPGEG
jgi:hypothetical protein